VSPFVAPANMSLLM